MILFWYAQPSIRPTVTFRNTTQTWSERSKWSKVCELIQIKTFHTFDFKESLPFSLWRNLQAKMKESFFILLITSHISGLSSKIRNIIDQDQRTLFFFYFLFYKLGQVQPLICFIVHYSWAKCSHLIFGSILKLICFIVPFSFLREYLQQTCILSLIMKFSPKAIESYKMIHLLRESNAKYTDFPPFCILNAVC